MSDPLVSVIMTSYNAVSFVGEAIDSVLSQTYEPLELIIVDDGSSDGTTDIVAGYAERTPERVRTSLKRTREGPCRARNDALARTEGSLVCWIDHDDLWLPTKVEEQVALLEASPEVGLVYTYFEAFDSDSGASIPWPDGMRDLEGDVLADLLVIGCFIGSITTMFRREGLDRRGGRLREREFSIGDDYYLWLTLALDWQVRRIPHVLARYRRHRRNESDRIASQVDLKRWRGAIVHEFLQEFPEAIRALCRGPRISVAQQLMCSARSELLAGHFDQAKCELRTVARLLSTDFQRRRYAA